MKYLILAILASLFIHNSAYAKNQNAEARSGVTKIIGRFNTFNRVSCTSTPFAKVSIRQPKNGKLTVKNQRHRVPKGSKCAGKMMNMSIVSYKSKPGFKGKDKGVVYFRHLRYSGDTVGSSYNVNYNITVK